MNKEFDVEEWKKARQIGLDVITKEVKEQMSEEEKLKTLNDLEEGKYEYKGLVQLRHVRDEAIKHIKAMRKEEIGYNDFGYKKDTIDTENWIIHFFNINEEELR